MPTLYALINGYGGVELYHLAANALKKAFALEPDNPEIIKVLGNKFYEVKKFAEAGGFYKKYLEIIPKDNHQLQTQVMLSLIDALNGADRTDEALILCDTLFQAEQSSVNAYVMQGDIYMVAGKNREANQSFKNALVIDKNNSKTLKAKQFHEDLHPYDTGYIDKLCFTLRHSFNPIDFKRLNQDLACPKTNQDNKKMIFLLACRARELDLSSKFLPVIPK